MSAKKYSFVILNLNVTTIDILCIDAILLDKEIKKTQICINVFLPK